TKKLQTLSLVLLGFMFVAPAVQAGVLVEPYLGYHTGKVKQTGATDITGKGVTFGGRFGYQQMGFSAGLDYMTGKWTNDATPSADISPTDLGFFVGFNFPMMVRVYGVYNFQVKEKVSSSAFNVTDEGNGIKLGVGFTSLPFVAINLEYLSSKLTKQNGT